MLERIHVCATLKLDQVVTNIVDGVSTKLARHAMQTRIRRKLRDLRDRIRAQAHVRTMIARFNFRELQKRLEIVRQASYVVFECGSLSLNVFQSNHFLLFAKDYYFNHKNNSSITQTPTLKRTLEYYARTQVQGSGCVCDGTVSSCVAKCSCCNVRFFVYSIRVNSPTHTTLVRTQVQNSKTCQTILQTTLDRVVEMDDKYQQKTAKSTIPSTFRSRQQRTRESLPNTLELK